MQEGLTSPAANEPQYKFSGNLVRLLSPLADLVINGRRPPDRVLEHREELTMVCVDRGDRCHLYHVLDEQGDFVYDLSFTYDSKPDAEMVAKIEEIYRHILNG